MQRCDAWFWMHVSSRQCCISESCQVVLSLNVCSNVHVHRCEGSQWMLLSCCASCHDIRTLQYLLWIAILSGAYHLVSSHFRIISRIFIPRVTSEVLYPPEALMGKQISLSLWTVRLCNQDSTRISSDGGMQSITLPLKNHVLYLCWGLIACLANGAGSASYLNSELEPE